MDLPPYMHPFVLAVPDVARHRDGIIDVYRPLDTADRPRPIVVFVPGGPLPPGLQAMPRDWPVFRGYGSLAADHGALGVTLDHPLHSLEHYPAAADEVARAVEQARGLPGADPDRVALWFFSGGGLLAADWLREPPPWLRCVAASYPVLDISPEWDADPRFRPPEAVASAGQLPILLTRVGRERPVFAATVEAFTTAAEHHGANLKVIDLPEGQHSFDTFDHTEDSRSAVTEAVSWVTTNLDT